MNEPSNPHSPTPWAFDPDTGFITSGERELIVAFVAAGNLDRLANGEMIVRAVNAHQALPQDWAKRALAAWKAVEGSSFVFPSDVSQYLWSTFALLMEELREKAEAKTEEKADA